MPCSETTPARAALDAALLPPDEPNWARDIAVSTDVQLYDALQSIEPSVRVTLQNSIHMTVRPNVVIPTGKTVKLQSSAGNQFTLSVENAYSVIELKNPNGTLFLENIIIQRNQVSSSVTYHTAVYVTNSSSALIMLGGAVITDNQAAGVFPNGQAINCAGSLYMTGDSKVINIRSVGGPHVYCTSATGRFIMSGRSEISGTRRQSYLGAAAVNVDQGASMVMTDCSKISDNGESAASYAYVVRVTAGSSFAMSGNAGIIDNNLTGLSLSNSAGTMSENAKITGNTGDLGGGVHLQESNAIFHATGGTIEGNTAMNAVGGGGGIFLYNGARIILEGDTRLINNHAANGNGGAIFIDASVTQVIKSSVRIEDNTAALDGGAIFISRDRLVYLDIEEGVTFKNNYAGSGGHLIDPSDMPMYSEHVHTPPLSVTDPYLYAYNNYDIAYAVGPIVTGYNTGETDVPIRQRFLGPMPEVNESVFGLFDNKGRLIKTIDAASLTRAGEFDSLFADVPITIAGTFYYTLRQLQPAGDKYLLDGAVRTVTLTAAPSGGDLIVTASITSGNPVFYGARKAGMPVALKARAALAGRDIAPGLLAVGLFDEKGRVVAQGCVDGDGRVFIDARFPDIPGAYDLTLRMSCWSKGVIEDCAKYPVSVTIDDNGVVQAEYGYGIPFFLNCVFCLPCPRPDQPALASGPNRGIIIRASKRVSAGERG